MLAEPILLGMMSRLPASRQVLSRMFSEGPLALAGAGPRAVASEISSRQLSCRISGDHAMDCACVVILAAGFPGGHCKPAVPWPARPDGLGGEEGMGS
jgi:hypothetical protein